MAASTRPQDMWGRIVNSIVEPNLKTKKHKLINTIQIMVKNYSPNQTIGFREMHGQSLVKVSQTRSNLIDGPDITGLGEIHIQILIIRIKEYDDILMLVKFETNWTIRLREYI